MCVCMNNAKENTHEHAWNRGVEWNKNHNKKLNANAAANGIIFDRNLIAIYIYRVLFARPLKYICMYRIVCMCVFAFSSIRFHFLWLLPTTHTVFFPLLDLGREICLYLCTSNAIVFAGIHSTNQWKSFSDDLAHFTHMIFPFPLIWNTPRHSTCADGMVHRLILRNASTYFMWLFINYSNWVEFEGKASIACSLAYNPIKRADCWKCKCIVSIDTHLFLFYGSFAIANRKFHLNVKCLCAYAGAVFKLF